MTTTKNARRFRIQTTMTRGGQHIQTNVTAHATEAAARAMVAQINAAPPWTLQGNTYTSASEYLGPK